MYLVGVHKQELVDDQREEHVQEEDLVAPDDALLLRLLVEPPGPLILNQLVLETVFLCHVRYKLLLAETGTTNGHSLCPVLENRLHMLMAQVKHLR